MRAAAYVLVAVFGLASTGWSQDRRIEWPPRAEFPASDRREVLALAKEMGVDDRVKVTMGIVAIRGDRFVDVQGRVTVNGHERSWMRARMFRDNWRGPDDAPAPEFRTHRVGR